MRNFIVEAMYQDGIFKPVGKVDLAENQRVRLSVEPLEQQMDALAWLETTRRHRQEFIDKHGYLPDSAPDIAADRLRDL